MKKYFFEAKKLQWEKPLEPKHIFSATAKTWVIAADPDQALTLAREQLDREYYGTGVLLGDIVPTGEADLPVDWSYGYDDARRSGRTAQIGDLVGGNVIR